MFDEALYDEHQTMTQQAKALEKECYRFCPNPFQIYAATKIVAQKKAITVAKLPTGSGKTFIAALVAKYFLTKGLKPAIVTSEGYLVTQMEQMLGSFRQ